MPAAFANRAASSQSRERATLSGALCTWMSIAPARSREAGARSAQSPAEATASINTTMFLCMASRFQRQRLIGCRAEHPQFFQFLRRVELAPEIEVDFRRLRARRGEDPIDEPEQRPAEIPGAETADGGELSVD